MDVDSLKPHQGLSRLLPGATHLFHGPPAS